MKADIATENALRKAAKELAMWSQKYHEVVPKETQSHVIYALMLIQENIKAIEKLEKERLT